VSIASGFLINAAVAANSQVSAPPINVKKLATQAANDNPSARNTR
jgi:hypothetical protein